MKTLMDAWKWYESARTNLVRMHDWAPATGVMSL